MPGRSSTVIRWRIALFVGLLAGLALPAPLAAQALDLDPRNASSSVVGGHAASIEAFPWLALVRAKNHRGVIRECTGTVVSARVVLTAGHCVESFDTGRTFAPSEYRVTTGVANRFDATPANHSRVSQVLAFPQFSLSNLRGDAGLLILSAPVSAPALPMAHVTDTEALAGGAPITVAGWGLTNGRGRKPAAVLQSAGSVVQEAGFCRERTRIFYPYFSPARQFCAIDSPGLSASACHGDSGGPALGRRADGSPLLVGITSLGDEHCDPRSPGVFTRVDQVAAWVDEWIAASEGRAPPPPIPVPRHKRLPYLPIGVANLLAKLVLREEFHGRYGAGREKRMSCWRIDREKVKCGVSWWLGPNDYWGGITVYLAFSENEIVLGSSYRIHWVNNHCWFHSAHRRSCVIHTRNR
jgi:hypothetical protein